MWLLHVYYAGYKCPQRRTCDILPLSQVFLKPNLDFLKMTNLIFPKLMYSKSKWGLESKNLKEILFLIKHKPANSPTYSLHTYTTEMQETPGVPGPLL